MTEIAQQHLPAREEHAAGLQEASMLYVRFMSGVQERLGPRLMEWEHSIVLTLFGWVLMQPHIALWTLPHENTWGAIIFAMGIVRISSLIVNGLRRRVTGWLRATCAGISMVMFGLIGIGYFFSGGSFAAAIFFPVVALFEWFNLNRAMRDVGTAS